MQNLESKVAVITGAASGIGRALSELLAERGCVLALVDINEEELRETARRVAAIGRSPSIFVADVSDRDRMQRLPQEVVEACGAVHVLVNNAGVSVGARFMEQSMEDFDWIMGINLWGVIYGCKFFLPYLQQQEEAHIVNVSSMFGFLGLAGQASYCMTKAAVRSLSEALWTELAHTNIRVTTVHPGGIRTNVIRSARIVDAQGRHEGIEMVERYGHSAEAAARKIVRAIEKNRPRVLIGPEAYLLEWFKRLFPVGTHKLLTAVYLRSDSTRRAWQRDAENRT